MKIATLVAKRTEYTIKLKIKIKHSLKFQYYSSDMTYIIIS
jgi:hypothetical protein